MRTKEELEDRIGWLASECGHEDFKIKQLEEELKRRRGRRDIMWKECTELSEELKKKCGSLEEGTTK